MSSRLFFFSFFLFVCFCCFFVFPPLIALVPVLHLPPWGLGRGGFVWCPPSSQASELGWHPHGSMTASEPRRQGRLPISGPDRLVAPSRGLGPGPGRDPLQGSSLTSPYRGRGTRSSTSVYGNRPPWSPHCVSPPPRVAREAKRPTPSRASSALRRPLCHSQDCSRRRPRSLCVGLPTTTTPPLPRPPGSGPDGHVEACITMFEDRPNTHGGLAAAQDTTRRGRGTTGTSSPSSPSSPSNTMAGHCKDSSSVARYIRRRLSGLICPSSPLIIINNNNNLLISSISSSLLSYRLCLLPFFF